MKSNSSIFSKVMTLNEWFIIPTIGLVTLFSALILLISTPIVWEPLYQIAIPSETEEVYRSDAKLISQAFWNQSTYHEVNASLQGDQLSQREIDHFEDVRNLVHFFFIPLCAGLFLLVAWKCFTKRAIQWHASLVYFIILGGALATWGALAWRHMFRTLHWWIFQNDSWILSSKSYTLKLYPYSVWQTASIAVMGILFLLLSVLSVLSIRCLLKRRQCTDILL